MESEETFWHRLIETDSGCWELPTKASSSGYKQIRTAWRRNQLSHRVAMELSTGEPLPEGVEVDHTCRNRACCRPQHLELVTPTINNRRKETTILTLEDAEDIRRMYAAGDVTQDELSRRYGVSRGHISNVITCAYWK